MGYYRLCSHCQRPQGPLTVEDIAATYDGPVSCQDCGQEREDDTWRTRTSLLAEALLAERVRALPTPEDRP